MKDSARKPLRLWPGVAIVILQLLLRFAIPLVAPDQLFLGVISGPVGSLLVILWWLFFSRAAWSERLGALGLIVVALFVTRQFVDVSIATGAQGVLFPILALTFFGLPFVLWAVATSRLSNRTRRISIGRDHPARLWSMGMHSHRRLHRQHLP